ncbi:MAG: iron ABC transporter permease [Desulfobacter sp.]|nr:MAG: iron ABC transporter permease [Desulfobacter sp.]
MIRRRGISYLLAAACCLAALAILVLSPAAWVVHAQALAGLSRDPSPMVLVITGIVVSALFRAGLSFIMYLANPYDQLTQIVFWTMGSFHTASWAKLEMVSYIILPGLFLMILFAWRLNLMTLDDDEARTMGMNTLGFRIFYILVSTLMVASAVASVGTIAWVGLIVPHMARLMAGPEYRRLIPATALGGGIFLMVMDSLARSLMLSEIPISIVTSLVDAPFLGFLVIRAGKKRRRLDPGA